MTGLGAFSGGGVNLNTQLPGTTAFNNQGTGHSAQFAHSYLDVGAYWRKLREDISASEQ
jgi:hypothetical protein